LDIRVLFGGCSGFPHVVGPETKRQIVSLF